MRLPCSGGGLQSNVEQTKPKAIYSPPVNINSGRQSGFNNKIPTLMAAQLVGQLIESVVSSLQQGQEAASPSLLSVANVNAEQRDAQKVNEIALAFKNAPEDKRQDAAHDLLIAYLVDEVYADVDDAAYVVVRSINKISDRVASPLITARTQEDLNALPKNADFVRDYVQVQSAGGTKESPLVISGLGITDNILNKQFANKFNDLVDDVNKQLRISKANISLVEMFPSVAHRDAIQLVPYDRKNPENRMSQFLGDIMQDAVVRDNDILSTAALQGIFATDGAFDNLAIKNNTLNVGGEHVISINGMLSGEISGNKGEDRALLDANDITLYPLRIGGGSNHVIIGFNNKDKNSPYNYQPIEGQPHSDLRTTPKAGSTNWMGVDMDLFREKVRALSTQEVNSVSFRELVANNNLNENDRIGGLLFDSGGRHLLDTSGFGSGREPIPAFNQEYGTLGLQADFDRFDKTIGYTLAKEPEGAHSRSVYLSDKSEFFEGPIKAVAALPTNQNNDKHSVMGVGAHMDNAEQPVHIDSEKSFFSGEFSDVSDSFSYNVLDGAVVAGAEAASPIDSKNGEHSNEVTGIEVDMDNARSPASVDDEGSFFSEEFSDAPDSFSYD